MSIAAMAEAWKVDCEPSQKLVLLALADHANDETWKAWPSLGHLSKKTGLNRRTVSRCIEQLTKRKLIGRINRGRESTIYHLHVAIWGQETPSGDTPLEAQSHEGGGDTPLGVGASCPEGRGDTPHEPSDNHQLEPPENPEGRSRALSPKDQTAERIASMDLPDWLPRDAWYGFVWYRREKRKDMTEHAAHLMLKKLGDLRESGNDPRAVLEQSIASGWTGVFPLKTPQAQSAGGGMAGTARRVGDRLRQSEQQRQRGRTGTDG